MAFEPTGTKTYMASISSLRFRPRSTPVASPSREKRVFLDEADGLLKTIDSSGVVALLGGSGGASTLAQISDMTPDARTLNAKALADMQAYLAVLPQVTNSNSWSDYLNRAVVYTAAGGSVGVNSAATGVQVINLGGGVLTLTDNIVNTLTVNAGEIVNFSVSDNSDGTFSFFENFRVTLVLTNDARLYNARTPAAHKSTHATGGSDALAPSDIGAASARTIVTGTTLAAAVGGSYLISNSGICSITDPAGTAAGQTYVVRVGAGTAWFGGAGTVYSASRFEIIRYYNGSAWSAVTPVLSDNLTLNGTANTAPNQTAASGSSLMTRDLGDARYSLVSYLNPPIATAHTLIPDTASSATSGSNATGATFKYTLRGIGTAGSYYTARFPVGALIDVTTGRVINFGKKMFFGLNINHPGATYSGGVSQAFVGGNGNYVPTANPAELCVGWSWTGTTLSAVRYASGSYSTVASGSAFASGSTYTENWLVIIGDGAGGFVWYYNGVQFASTASGPTGKGAVGSNNVILSSYTPSTLGAQNDLICRSITFGYLP